jgi:DNA-binding response OmpR family regulator
VTNAKTASILVYSSNSSLRELVRNSLGSNLGSGLPNHTVKEFATGAALRLFVDDGGTFDLLIVDAESNPEGGLGLCRQLKDEVYNCPPVLAIIARASDSWLGKWSRADDLILQPLDPFTLAQKAGDLLATRLGISNSKTLAH